MQTELYAIKQALSYTLTNETGPTVIHCDSMSALQALSTQKIKENKNLLSHIHILISQHKTQNREVILNWIPSHIGIVGNDEADRLAKQTNLITQVQINVQQSLQQFKNNTKQIWRKSLKDNVNYWVDQNSRSAQWYHKVSDMLPAAIDKHTPRKIAVIIHRLRLGYRSTWEINTEINRPCTHCDSDTNKPLLH